MRKIAKKTELEARRFTKALLEELGRFSEIRFNKKPKIKLRLGFSPRHNCSFTYGLLSNQPNTAQMFIWAREAILTKSFVEYDHIANDPDIGDIDSKHWKHRLAGVIVHEYAHILDEYKIKIPTSFRSYSTRRLHKEEAEHHGTKWQYLYRILRKQFVNNLTFKKI